MNQNEKYKRENNFDLLKIICAVAVIMIHISAEYLNFVPKTGGTY